MPLTLEATELLTMDEITERYAPDWVFLCEVESDGHNRILRGRVIAHAPTHEQLFDLAMPYAEGGRYAVWCLAEFPDDLHMIA